MQKVDYNRPYYRRVYVLLMLCITASCSTSSGLEFVPDGFTVPESHTTPVAIIEKLTLDHAVLDYEAVMDSRVFLRDYFGGEWPPDDFTLEQNREDIRAHETFSDARSSFAYTVLSLDRSRVLGCIYINPTDSLDYDAQVHSWVRTGEDLTLKPLIAEWIEQAWPFKKVLY